MRRITAALVTAALAVSAPFTASAAGPVSSPLAFSADHAAVRERMVAAGYGDLAAPGRNFVAFDPVGDGRAVEVLGDLAAARRVVVLVPGTDTTLRDFDRGLGGVARRAPSVQARAVYDAVGRAADVAVVAWLGYDPPEGIGVAVARQERAAEGARELQHFIATTVHPHATVVVVGHSYGTVVMGLAASGFGANVTDLVALASPGLGTDFESGATLWAATADSDWIQHIPNLRIAGFGHAPSPADAGAHPLPTAGVEGHDHYLLPTSPTLRALATIILTPTPKRCGLLWTRHGDTAVAESTQQSPQRV